MTTYLVVCRSKHAISGRVESIGCFDPTMGAELRFSEEEAIKRINQKTARFIVRDAYGHEAIVEVEKRDGREFLITKRDQYITDNLLALPDCSSKPIISPPPYRPVAPARSHGVDGKWEAF